MANNIQIPDFIGQFQNTMSGIGDGMTALGKYKLEKDAQDARQARDAGLIKDERDFKLLTAKNLSESNRSLASDDRKFKTDHEEGKRTWATERDDRLRREGAADRREDEKIAADAARETRIANEKSLLKTSYDKMTMDSLVAEAKATGTSMAFLESLKDEEGNYPPDTARRMQEQIMKDGTSKVMLLEKERARKVMQIIAFEKGSTDRTIVDPQIMEARRLGVQNTYADSATEALLVKWLGPQQATLMMDGIRLGLDAPPAEIDKNTGKITKPGMIRNANVLQSIALSKRGGAWFGTSKHEDQREIYKKLINNINLQTEGMEKTNKQVLSSEVIFLKQALADLEVLNKQSIALKKYHPLRNALLEDEYNKAMESIVTPGSAQNSTTLADVNINPGVNEHSFETVDPANEMGLTDAQRSGSGGTKEGDATDSDLDAFGAGEEHIPTPGPSLEGMSIPSVRSGEQIQQHEELIAQRKEDRAARELGIQRQTNVKNRVVVRQLERDIQKLIVNLNDPFITEIRDGSGRPANQFNTSDQTRDRHSFAEKLTEIANKGAKADELTPEERKRILHFGSILRERPMTNEEKAGMLGEIRALKRKLHKAQDFLQ